MHPDELPSTEEMERARADRSYDLLHALQKVQFQAYATAHFSIRFWPTPGWPPEAVSAFEKNQRKTLRSELHGDRC
jgi:hypothetical protein